MRSFARALLRLVAALAAVVAATTLLLANPLTRPTDVVGAAIEAETHVEILTLGSELIMRQVVAGEADEVAGETEGEAPALTEEQESRVRIVIEDSFTAVWLERELTGAATAMEAWIAKDGELPVTIDLTEPKERIRAHPDALLLVAALADPEETEQIDPATLDPRLAEHAVDDFLTELPDEVRLDQAGWWADTIDRARDLRERTRDVGRVAGVAALIATAAGIALSPRRRLAATPGWVGWLMLWTALPLLTIGWALPTVATGAPLPDEPALVVGVVEGTWSPARTIGWVTLGLALILWAASHILRERASEVPTAADGPRVETLTPVGTDGRELVASTTEPSD